MCCQLSCTLSRKSLNAVKFKNFKLYWHYTAHEQKQLLLSFRLQLWQRRWIQQPRFPIRVWYFGNQSTRSVLFWHNFYPEIRHISTSGLLEVISSKSGTRVTLAKWISSTKFEADPTIRFIYCLYFCCLPFTVNKDARVTEIWHIYFQYVTLHCYLDDLPFDHERTSDFFYHAI